jgi:hypothetical protein
MRGWGWAVALLVLCAALQFELARTVSKAAGHPKPVIVLLSAASLLGALCSGVRILEPFSRLDAALTDELW